MTNFSTDTNQSYEANRNWWDAVTKAHVQSSYYGLESFLKGRNTIPEYVTKEIGDITAKKLLHLQCHFGQDTLSLARMGASVTGIDFGGEAIERAKQLTGEIGVEARFMRTNVYDLPEILNEQFEVVFTSNGVLAWLHDLDAWGKIIANSLLPGGVFYISDFHPLMESLQDERPIERPEDLFVAYPYFTTGTPWFTSGENSTDYADRELCLDLETFEWFHSLQDILSATLDAGLEIELFREHQFCVYQARQGMVKEKDGLWHMPKGISEIPLMFSLRARKPV